MFLSRYASSVKMLVRGGNLEAAMSDYLIKQIAANDKIDVHLRTQLVEAKGEKGLESVTVKDLDSGDETELPAAAMFLLIGAVPYSGFVDGVVQCNHAGFVLTGSDWQRDGERPKGWRLARDPYLLETNVPGIFAAGDVRQGAVRACRVGRGRGRRRREPRAPVSAVRLMLESLRAVPILTNLPEEDLELLNTRVESVSLEAGETLFREGDAGDRCYIIESGELEIVKQSGGREVFLSVRGAGDVIGELALMEDLPRMATVRAVADTVLLSVEHQHLQELLAASPSAAAAMFDSALSRSRATEARLRQSEKMAQLGTLTAGVAHELNNPASAIRRGSSQLQSELARLGAAQAQLYSMELTDADLADLTRRGERAVEMATAPSTMDPVSLAVREESIESWLTDNGVPEPWTVASTLACVEYDLEDLHALGERFDSGDLATVVRWIDATCSVQSLITEIGQASARVSSIVGALKSYSYLDQAPVQEVDVHRGLDDTLLILRGKLGPGVSIVRDYDPQVPTLQAYGSELNQVWTNLIDNAVYAVGDGGTIQLRTRLDGIHVVVQIEDDGPGIPDDIQDKVFDPFFTTKPVGEGTGLGLDISYGIVVDRHRGEIQVESRPGRTCFEVWLPLNLDADAGGSEVEGT